MDSGRVVTLPDRKTLTYREALDTNPCRHCGQPHDPEHNCRLVRVVLTRDEAEDLCWAYAGLEEAQTSDLTTAAFNAFKIAARMGGSKREPKENEIYVEVSREAAEAMGYAKDDALEQEVLSDIEFAL